MAKLVVLKDNSTGEEVLPKTNTRNVYNDEGKSLNDLLTSNGTIPYIDIEIGGFAPGYINADGTTGSSGAWAHSEYIPISEGVIYKLSTAGWASNFGVCLYAYYSSPQVDQFIDGYVNKSPVNFNNEPITPPVGARYIRFSSLNVSDASGFRLTTSLDGASKAMNSLLEYKSDRINTGFTFPKYLDCPKNLQTTIYLDGISGECDFEDDDIVITKTGFNSNIIKTKSALIYTPGTSDTESVLTVKRVDKNAKILYQNDLILRPINRGGGDGLQKNICISGDSLIEVNPLSVVEPINLLRADGDYIINTIGTKSKVEGGVTYHHEGRAGWTWGRYLDTAYATYNAFMINGELNFKAYMTNNFPDTGNGEIDIFLMSLGTNDANVYGVKMETIIANAKSFIDVLLSEAKGFPNCKVIIGMPAMGAPGGNASYNARVFRKKINLLNRWYVDTFDNGRYHANVTCVMHGAFIDRKNAYSYTDIVPSEYIPSATVRQYTDFLHPMAVGYKQFGRGYYSKIRCLLNGLL